MSKEQLYRQCKLEKATKTGKLIDVAFIPSQFAKVGKQLNLKKNDEWDGPWLVVEASGSLRTFDELDVQRDAQKRWESVLK